MGVKIRSPKEVLEENKNRKLEVDTTGDIVEKLNKEYENIYGKRNSKTNKKDIFLDVWAWIFLLVAVGILVLNFLGIL